MTFIKFTSCFLYKIRRKNMNFMRCIISLHVKNFQFLNWNLFHKVAESRHFSGSLRGKPSLAVRNRRVHVAATVQALQSFCTVQSSSRCNSFTIKRLVKPAGVLGRLFTVLLLLKRALNRGNARPHLIETQARQCTRATSRHFLRVRVRKAGSSSAVARLAKLCCCGLVQLVTPFQLCLLHKHF